MIDWIAIWLYATPLLCAALGDVVVQRSGQLNIGLEGQMLLAAFGAFWACSWSGNPWIGVMVGTAFAVIAILLSGIFTVNLAADQVVVGMAVLLLALGLSSFGYRSMVGETGSISAIATLPKWKGIDPVMAVSILLVPFMTFTLFNTKLGLQLRACGENPEAVSAARVNVIRLRYGALLVGGLLAGLAGAELSLGIAGSFSENMAQGRGFVAIAMVSFGRWHPVGASLACLLIGWLESIQFLAQSKGWEVPFRLLLSLPYVAALVVLVIVGKGANGPAALGKPYERNK